MHIVDNVCDPDIGTCITMHSHATSGRLATSPRHIYQSLSAAADAADNPLRTVIQSGMQVTDED